MSVKEYSEYTHYENGCNYYVITIALPLRMMPRNGLGTSLAFHTEKEKDIEIYEVGNVSFSNTDEFLVLYKKVGSSRVYARPVDMFFEHVDGKTKRFKEV
ncbi:DUF1653 domain-containing protein [Bacillus wiedmannii]|uniref:DUF1653 domain-containing protein n=1 Tax=Bacillus wiedmannii TaxID=1890302 RepID=UPI00124580A0|nr:DUF1653 domain-containing protein [Bacillus wiedmannii]